MISAILTSRRLSSYVASSRIKLSLLINDRCPLCVYFKRDLEHFLKSNEKLTNSFIIEERKIKDDPDIFEEYRYDVPVLLKDDEVLLKHRFNQVLFERALECLKGP